MHTVEGMLFYYPCKDGKETRPVGFVPFVCLSKESQQRRKLRATSSSTLLGGRGLSQKNSASASSSASSSSYEASSEDVINLADESDSGYDSNEKEEKTVDLSKTVSVFWQNRYVSKTHAPKLPFFPTATSNLECSNAQLPMQWRNRIICYLFFNNNFSHISNNKLKFLLDQELGDWFDQMKNVRRQLPLFCSF